MLLRTALVVACAAFGVVPPTAALGQVAADDLTVRLRVQLGRDLGQNAGTLFEALDDEGKPVAGAGFLGAYNTQDRSDRRLLHFYVKVKSDDAFRPEALPRPSADAGTYLFGFDNRLWAFGRSGVDANLRQWDPAGGLWRVDTSSVPLSIHVDGGVLAPGPRQITHDGRSVLAPSEGLIAESYYAAGFLVFRRRRPEATPAGNDLVACRWTGEAQAARSADGIRLPLHTPREFVYAYGQLGQKILAATNTGGVYVFDAEDEKWTTLRTPNGVSFQIYAAVNYEDRLLLGQYPTGELFEFDGEKLRHLPGQPPVMTGVSPHAREAQTLAIYGGDLYAGVWPWGEVWRLDRRDGQWVFAGRMFTHPEPTVATTHPYEKETQRLGQVLNRWGQRVTSLTPHGDSLYIATSSKGGAPYEKKFAFLADDEAQQYGAVYRYRRPGCLAAPFSWRREPTTFEFRHEDGRLAVYQDDRLIGAADCRHPPVAKISRVVWGDGVFGPLAGKIDRHEHHTGAE